MRLFEIRLYSNNIALKNAANSKILEEYLNLLQKFESKKEWVGVSYSSFGMAEYFIKSGNFDNAVLEPNAS